MIGPYCYITDHDHGVDEQGPISAQALVEAPVKVGDNVWIGAHSVILKGVSIGDNAVIGAGAVVTMDVGPGERVAGVPARGIGAGRQIAGERHTDGSARNRDVGGRLR
jgi:acetyltransferase-like isoleucine patch superfamily enzyme